MNCDSVSELIFLLFSLRCLLSSGSDRSAIVVCWWADLWTGYVCSSSCRTTFGHHGWQWPNYPLHNSPATLWSLQPISPVSRHCLLIVFVCLLLSYSAHPSLSSLFIHSMRVSFSKPFKSCLLFAAAEGGNVTKVLRNKQKKSSLSVCAFQFEVAKHSRFVFPSVFSLFLLLVDCCCLPKEELRTLDHVMKQSVTSQGEGRSSVDLFSSNRAMSSNLVFLGAHVLMQGRL